MDSHDTCVSMVGILVDCLCLLIIFTEILQGSMTLWRNGLVDGCHWKGTLFAVSLHFCFIFLWNFVGCATCFLSNYASVIHATWCRSSLFAQKQFICPFIRMPYRFYCNITENLRNTFQWCYRISGSIIAVHFLRCCFPSMDQNLLYDLII